MNLYFKIFVITILSLLCPKLMLAEVPIPGSASPSREPLEFRYYDNTLTLLTSNRQYYNMLNDSIFRKADKTKWTAFFRYRANRFGQLYEADRNAIDTLKYDIQHYALADSVYYRNDAKFSDLYNLKSIFFLNKIMTFALSNYDDPFLVKELAQPICDLVIRKMPESEISIMAARIMSQCYSQIIRFQPDKATTDQLVKYCEHAISFDRRMPKIHDKAIRTFIPASYVALFSIKNEFVGSALIRNYNRMQQLLSDKDMQPFFDGDGASIKKTMVETLSSAGYSILRNYYMTYEWDKHNLFTDSVALKDLERNSLYSQAGKRTAFSKRALTEVYLELKTYDEAFAEVQTHYAGNLTPKEERIDVTVLFTYTNPILNLIFLLDNSSLPFEVKRAHMLEYANAVLESVRKCNDNQSNNIRNSIVSRYLTYDRLLKYMTSAEKEDFFHSMLVYTQVQTYAHSLSVSSLCQEVTNAVIDSRPDLLVGLFGTRCTADVKKNRKRFVNFMKEAGLYHDLGKLSMAELVKNDYRPMTDDEFAIVKTHPERGAKYLECDSAMMQYRDLTLGHHKWYNGKGGYPRNFDNTKSPYRVLIDVLTICDCLDAATDRVARNYANKKRYADLVKEFQAQSGTRYSPDIANLLATDKQLIKKLTAITEGGWVNNYFEIYKDYFSE